VVAMLRQLMDSAILFIAVLIMLIMSLFTPKDKSKNRKRSK